MTLTVWYLGHSKECSLYLSNKQPGQLESLVPFVSLLSSLGSLALWFSTSTTHISAFRTLMACLGLLGLACMWFLLKCVVSCVIGVVKWCALLGLARMYFLLRCVVKSTGLYVHTKFSIGLACPCRSNAQKYQKRPSIEANEA
jgi:hypothetical protein